MIFQHPEYLWKIMAASAVIFIGYLTVIYRGEKVLKYFGGRRLIKSYGSKITSVAVLAFRSAVVVTVLALFSMAYWADPKTKETRNFPVYEQAEICFAVDASRSALARDIRTDKGVISRFNFAKAIVSEAKNVVGSDDAPCLIFFAGSAITTVSVTSYFGYIDVGWEHIASDLKFADEYFVEYEIPQGSNFAPVILKALSAFSERPTRKILVVVSDGEPERGSDADVEKRRADELAELQEAQKEIAAFRAKNELAIEFLGTGDTTKPSPLPKIVAKDGTVLAYHKYSSGPREGQPILSRPDPSFLFSAAQALGGKYRHVTDLDDAKKELRSIFSSQKKIISWEKREEITEAWHYFVAAGLTLLFIIPFMKSP